MALPENIRSTLFNPSETVLKEIGEAEPTKMYVKLRTQIATLEEALKPKPTFFWRRDKDELTTIEIVQVQASIDILKAALVDVVNAIRKDNPDFVVSVVVTEGKSL